MAGKLGLLRAVSDGTAPVPITLPAGLARVPFNDPDPFRQLHFPNVLAAKLAIVDDV